MTEDAFGFELEEQDEEELFDQEAREKFTRVPNDFLHASGLSNSERLLWILMRSYAHKTKRQRGNECWAYRKTLAASVGVTPRQITTLIASLQAKGCIRAIVNKGRCNTYQIVPVYKHPHVVAYHHEQEQNPGSQLPDPDGSDKMGMEVSFQGVWKSASRGYGSQLPDIKKTIEEDEKKKTKNDDVATPEKSDPKPRKSTAEKRESKAAKTQREIAALRQRLDGGSAATLDAVVAALPELETRPGDQEVIAGLITEHPQVDWAQLARNIKARYASNAGTVRWAEKFNTFIANSLNPKMKYNIPHVDGTSHPLVRGEIVAQPISPLAHKFDRSDRHTAPKLYDDALWQIVLDQLWQDDSHRWIDADAVGVETGFEYGYSKLVPMGIEEIDGEGSVVSYTIGFPSSISRWLRDLKWKIEKTVLVSYRYHNDISHDAKLDLKVEWIDLG